jgi:hypothetical protein
MLVVQEWHMINFGEYLEMGWVKQVDYTTIVEMQLFLTQNLEIAHNLFVLKSQWVLHNLFKIKEYNDFMFIQLKRVYSYVLVLLLPL